MSRLFRFACRPDNNSNQVPQVRAGVIHLIGPGALRAECEHLLFESGRQRQVRFDREGLELVLAYGDISMTSAAVAQIHQAGAALALLSHCGSQCRGRFVHENSSHSLSRLLHIQSWEDRRWQLCFARQTVADKLSSQLNAARHYQRQGKKIAGQLLTRLEAWIDQAKQAIAVDQLRGIEGSAAAAWWAEYGKLFRPPWTFSGRVRRPPTDPVNALLSLGYTMLYQRVAARLEAAGFDAALGALHEYRPGRLSLACDLMEPLRVPVVDRWVLALCQQGIVNPSHFQDPKQDRGVRLTEQAFPLVLQRFEEHWHQGLFRLVLDELANRFRNSLDGMVAAETSRAKSWLKTRALKRQGSGNEDTEQ